MNVFNIQDKCIVVGDRTVCSRLANDGIFLLDTVFQPSIPNLSSQISAAAAAAAAAAASAGGSLAPAINSPTRTLELNVNDAASLLASFKQIELDLIPGLDPLIAQLEVQLAALTNKTSSSDYSEETNAAAALDDLDLLAVSENSWTTVKITDSYYSLYTTLTQAIEEIKRTNLQSVSIPILSLLLDRLYRLDATLIEKQLATNSQSGAAAAAAAGSFGNTFDKRYMCSEATRRATFNEWPHMDYKWVLPDALAQAGFYHQPTHPGDDRTICFVCDLCLVAWEQHDQPWSEHERHSPICQFVRGELTENVPLALTAATQAATNPYRLAPPGQDKIVCTSELSSERYFAVSNSAGHIIVYDSKDLLKVF